VDIFRLAFVQYAWLEGVTVGGQNFPRVDREPDNTVDIYGNINRNEDGCRRGCSAAETVMSLPTFQRSLLVPSSRRWVLMMEAVRTSWNVVNLHRSTRRYDPEDRHLRTHRRENLKSSTGICPQGPTLQQGEDDKCCLNVHVNRPTQYRGWKTPQVLFHVSK
jgi:hypothetical protein